MPSQLVKPLWGIRLLIQPPPVARGVYESPAPPGMTTHCFLSKHNHLLDQRSSSPPTSLQESLGGSHRGKPHKAHQRLTRLLLRKRPPPPPTNSSTIQLLVRKSHPHPSLKPPAPPTPSPFTLDSHIEIVHLDSPREGQTSFEGGEGNLRRSQIVAFDPGTTCRRLFDKYQGRN